MSTILVTGGAGFIGSNFVLHMLSAYDDVRIVTYDALTYAGNLENIASVLENPRHAFVKGDIRDIEALRDVFSRHGIDRVVNFAAESHVDRSIVDPLAFVSTNVDGTAALLSVAREFWEAPEGGFGDVRFLQVSTDEVYGSLGPEGYFTESTPLDPHSPYSASKASADLVVKAYGDTFGMPVVTTRCSNNYGPYQFPEKLIPLMISNALEHKPLPLYGDGLNVRDWLYVEDHCRAIDLVLQKAPSGSVYNVGGHNERTNEQIVRLIIDYLSQTVDSSIDEGLITHVEDRLGHDRRYGIDPAKIDKEIGWQPQTCFEDGIVRTIEWYLSNRAWLDRVTSGAYADYYESMYGGRTCLD